jgi:ELWxxDGT repeat protein
MPTAAGAYAASTGTIYLNEDWLQTASQEQLLAVLTEELGHHLDNLLNVEDTPGDEGALFAGLLENQDLSAEGIETYRSVDDRGVILVDGQWAEVEMQTLVSKAANPGLVSNINLIYGSFPKYLTTVGSTIFFSADDGSSGREPWKSDGTTGGTVRVFDIYPGGSDSTPQNITAVGNTLFFTAVDGTNGRELWKTDGI